MKTNELHILAIDLGTSGLKAALINVQGEVRAWESEPVNLYLTADGGAEQSPEEWWQALVSAARRLMARGLVEPGAIGAVCCSTQGEGTIAVDRSGKALMNCILWMDMRGAPYLQRQVRGRLNVAGVDAIRLLRWLRLTGGMPSLTGKDPAAHMLLVREAYPEVYERTYKFLNVLDYLNLRLTGRFTATYDSIVTSWVTDNRRPDAIHYDTGLVRGSGIETDKFPELAACTEVIGCLSAQAAADLGLGEDVKVVGGAIDNTAAAIGSGAVQDYLPHVYIGTSSWIAAHVPFKKTDVGAGMASIPCAMPDRYLLTALQATAGGNLTFLRDNILYHKDELLNEACLPDIFKVLDKIAERTPAGSNGVIYTPWIWGERSPVEERSLRAGVYNLGLNNTREDIIRAFLEGVALNSRWVMKPVEKFLGRRVECVHMAGGGAQSNIWCQIYADVLGVEVRQVQVAIMANARGGAWIGAGGRGEIGFQDVAGLVRLKHVYAPNPANRGLYDERFEVFQQIYRQMRPVYRRLNLANQPLQPFFASVERDEAAARKL